MPQVVFSLICAFTVSTGLFGQFTLSHPSCNSVTVASDSEPTSIQNFTFCLEKQIATDIWQKISQEKDVQGNASFNNLSKGTYRILAANPKHNFIGLASEISGKERQKLYFYSNSFIIDECSNPKNDLFNVWIYPNPAEDHINISHSYQNENIALAVYSTIGELFYIQNISSQITEIQCSQWLPGIYIFEFRTASGESTSYRFVKL